VDKKTLTKYIVAFCYGDGFLGKHGKNARFQANNIIDNLDYIEWRASILENVSGLSMSERVPKIKGWKVLINTTTHTHPMYTTIWQRLYLNGRKVFDPHYLKLLDWETLAILYMDDGTLGCTKQEYKDKTYRNYYPKIATCAYSYGDNLLLKKAIKDKLGIEFNINRHSRNKRGETTYILSLQANSRERFLSGVEQYILPSFRYKIYPNDELL